MKNSHSIQWKLIIVYIIIVLIAMIISGMFILWQLEEYEYGKIEKELESTTNSFMAVTLEDDSAETVLQTFKDYLEENNAFFADDGTEIYILDAQGECLYSSISQITLDDKAFSKGAVISAVNGTKKFENIKENVNGEVNELMAYAFPVVIDGEVKAIIYTRVSTDSVSDTMKTARSIIIVSILIAMIFSVVTGYIFAKSLTDPIKELTVTASKVAKGEVGKRVNVQGNDEIGQLASTFNFMSVELNKTLSDISNEKNKLEAVFEHMQDGIIAFNTKGELTHSNNVINSILELGKEIDKVEEIKELLKIDFDFNEFAHSRENKIKNFETTYLKKLLNIVVVNYLNDKNVTEGVIIMIQDVTEQRKLDNMRKEFVANVSHELRTPLTTVKGYVETLMEGGVEDKDTSEKFLRVINNETDRMALLVSDLLELSRYDNHQIKLDNAKIDIYELVSDAVLAQKITADNKKQELICNLPETPDYIIGDYRRIGQVITNILSNAIKYSEEHATITVYSEKKDKTLEIIVKDTGMGIPKEDLSRIFERFYRVDKARSRAMGGTGLGLAIAKEIMQLHGGDIVMESEYKVGTTAHLIFPL